MYRVLPAYVPALTILRSRPDEPPVSGPVTVAILMRNHQMAVGKLFHIIHMTGQLNELEAWYDDVFAVKMLGRGLVDQEPPGQDPRSGVHHDHRPRLGPRGDDLHQGVRRHTAA